MKITVCDCPYKENGFASCPYARKPFCLNIGCDLPGKQLRCTPPFTGFQQPCPRCRGDGQTEVDRLPGVPPERCHACGGTGLEPVWMASEEAYEIELRRVMSRAGLTVDMADAIVSLALRRTAPEAAPDGYWREWFREKDAIYEIGRRGEISVNRGDIVARTADELIASRDRNGMDTPPAPAPG